MRPQSFSFSAVLNLFLGVAYLITSGNSLSVPEPSTTSTLSLQSRFNESVWGTSSQWKVANTKSPFQKRSRTEELARLLADFVAQLKSFILLTEFNFQEFENVAESLEAQLGELTVSVIHGVCNKDISQLLDFCTYMFNFMADACETLRHYDLVGSQDLHLLHFLVDFHVRTLSLLDSSGLPDRKIPGLSFKVSRFSAVVRTLKKEFDGLKNVRFGMRRVFSKQYAKALETVLKLERKFGKRDPELSMVSEC